MWPLALPLVTLLVPACLPSPSVRCFQCSEFPSQPGDRDEALGPCPGQRISMNVTIVIFTFTNCFMYTLYSGWLRPPVIFPSESVYDGCMTILLSNGSIVAQSGVRTE